MEQPIVLIDLFSGIGGFAKGLLDAGIEVSHHYFSEIDKHAIANYTYNFPHAEYLGPVQTISGQSIREKHPQSRIIVSFGWPCQDNSSAGKRKGQREGTRSGLLFEAGRIVFESKAQNFVAENVKGLSSVNEGFDFYETLRFLTYFNTDSAQYTLEMQLFDTDWFLPQSRERFYFVGHIGTGGGGRVLPIVGDGKKNCDLSGQSTNTITKRYYGAQATGSYIVEGSINELQRGDRVRRLTEIECERLQGFPDNWTKYGIYEGVKEEIGKPHRYELCGNAVSTVIPIEIFKALFNPNE